MGLEEKSDLGILIVEDEEPVSRIFFRALEKRGYSLVETAYDGKEGLDKFGDCHYDLAIVDLGLPKISGEDVIKQMRKINPAIKILVMSGYCGSDRLAPIKDFFDAYLQKPVEIKELIQAVDSLLLPSVGNSTD